MRHLRAIALAALLCAPALAAADAQVLRLVTGNDYKPYADQSLPDGGLAAHILKEAAAEAGVAIEVAFEPWARGWEMTRAGAYDGTFPWVRTEERQLEVGFADEPLITITNVFFVHRDDADAYRSLEELEGTRACLPISYSLASPITQRMADQGRLLLEEPDDVAHCFLMLERKRVDWYSTLEQAGWETVTAAGVRADELAILPFPHAERHLTIAHTPDRPAVAALVARLMDAVARMRADGSLARVEADYLRALEAAP